MSSLLIWNPTSCGLQLTFSRPNGTATAPILAGSTYQGTSIICYRREPLEDEGAERGSVNVQSSSEYAEFLRHRRVVADRNALHLHALTVGGGIYKDAKPLQVTSYQVSCVSSGVSSGGSSGKSGSLKVLSVEQEDAAAAAVVSSSLGKGGSAIEKRQKSSKAKPNNNNKKSGGAASQEEAVPTHATAGDASVDWGSKLVLFEGADNLTVNSEVELTVQFTGTVQSFDHGGIYAARAEHLNANNNNNNATGVGDVPLLTHLEVRFARCAFPCPDDPQYRLDWQLRSLQLPDTYNTVLTNGEEQGRKELTAQRAVQWSFAPCGPLPAYIFAIACFPEELDQVETTMNIPEFSGDVVTGLKGTGATLSCVSIPLRVLARRQARISLPTLERVLRVTAEAVVTLQQLFDCPLPLLQSRHLDVLLGPTMPFISGMEHHCCIILNETIFQPAKKPAGGGNAEVVQTELIVHELAHHWVGNALGLPFPVKEGICQVLEQCIGDSLLGKPMRKFKPDSTLGAASSSESPSGTNTIQASEKGREFTGTSYQLALSAIKRLVAESGFEAFEGCLQHLVHEHVVMPTIAVEEQGGAQMLRCIGAGVPPPPYLSTEAFLRFMDVSA